MRNVFAQWFHMVERWRERELYADLHANLYRQGYTYQVSFYGTMQEPYDGKHYQARIEVLTAFEPSEPFIVGMFNMLSGFKPEKEYTLFVYTPKGLVEALLV